MATPEQLEFSRKAFPLLIARMIPFLSQERKTKVVGELIDGLSETTLILYIQLIVEQINMTKRECLKYHSDNAQFRSIVDRFPRLEYFRGRVVERIKKERRKHGLD